MAELSIFPSARTMAALAVATTLLTACGGGGDGVATPVASTTSGIVADLNQAAQGTGPNGSPSATPQDAAAPSDSVSEPVVIATDTSSAPQATANDAAAPSDNI